MNRLRTVHPALKGIALILAMMVLMVQFTEAFHHHYRFGGKPGHQQISAKAQLQVRVDCAICHYFAHHYAPVQAEQTQFSFVNTPIILITSVAKVSPVISGPHFILSNKGPPAPLLMHISYAI